MSVSLIRERVKVQILRDTGGIDRLGFGLPLFIGETASKPRVAFYRNYDEVLEEFDAADEEAKAALAYFAQEPQPTELLIGNKASGETYVEALDEIREVRDDFFCVLIQSRDDADALALAPVVSALEGTRQFWFVSADADIIDPLNSADIASQFKAAEYDQARVLYHSLGASAYPDLALAGRVLPIAESAESAPGTAAWHDQPIQSIPGDDFTKTQRAALEEKNADFFIEVGGAVRAMGGKMASGEWGDIMHGIAWLDTRLSEDVYSVLARAADRLRKVPFTDEGIGSIEAAVRTRLEIAVDTQLLAEGFEVSVPAVENTLEADRLDRKLKDVTFTARLAGAIKFVEITGVVSV